MQREHYVFYGQKYKYKDGDRSMFLFTQPPPTLDTVTVGALTRQPRENMAGIFALERKRLRNSYEYWS